MAETVLQLADYAVFASLLVVSLAVGFFFAYKERKQSADNYLLNNEHMNPYAAGLSIFVSMLSALTIIGMPTEVYLFGNAMVWRMVGGALGLYMVHRTFLPKLYELKLYSLFDYTKLRYKSALITNLTLGFGLGALLFHLMALSYLTALAFSTVINLPVWANLVLLNTVATIYTLCGGMKAVIWTDCLQSFVMLFSLVFICVKLWTMLGSDEIIEASEDTNTNQWADLNINFAQRTSSWGYFTAELFYVWTRVGFGQYFMQRCVACSSLQDARKALNVGILIALFVGAVITPLTGMAAITYFNGCDPILSGELSKPDQIMPYLAAKVFENLPGLTGLFISSAYSATLSTLSTGLNSFATVVFKTIWKKDLPAEKMIKYQRIFMFAFGYFVVAAAYSLKFLPDTVISIVFIVTGGLGTCSAFSFVCGMMSKRTNRKGVLAGYIAGSIPITLSLIGMFYVPRDSSFVNQTHRNTDFCSNSTTERTTQLTELVTTVEGITEEADYPFWHVVFWISPLFQAFFGGVTFTIACFTVSYCSEPDEVDEKLLIEIFQSPFYPAWLRNAFKIKTESEHNEKEDLVKLDSRHDEELAFE